MAWNLTEARNKASVEISKPNEAAEIFNFVTVLVLQESRTTFSSLETETFESNRKDKALDMLMSKCDAAMMRGTIE